MRHLTRNGEAGGDLYEFPQLSRDGTYMTFAYGNRAYIADPRAKRRRRLPDPPGGLGGPSAPRLSPDGREGLFFDGYMGVGQRCRVPLPAGRPARCADVKEGGRAYWGFGPRGRLMSVDGDRRTDLCFTTLAGRCRDVLHLLRRGTFFMSPATSPDGRLVAAGVEEGDDTRIVLFDGRTGRRVRDLTRGHNDYPPAWSPDGRHVAFRRDAVYEGDVVVASICIVSVRGGRVRCPVRRRKELGMPSWGR
jgi:hypothetical protein